MNNNEPIKIETIVVGKYIPVKTETKSQLALPFSRSDTPFVPDHKPTMLSKLLRTSQLRVDLHDHIY